MLYPVSCSNAKWKHEGQQNTSTNKRPLYYATGLKTGSTLLKWISIIFMRAGDAVLL